MQWERQKALRETGPRFLPPREPLGSAFATHDHPPVMMWTAATGDEILKWNPTTYSFDAVFSPTMPLNGRHTLHFRDTLYTDLYSMAGELCIQTTDGQNDGNQFLAAAANNVFTTSWLDMGHPTSIKHLSHISAQVSGQETDLQVRVEYRTELNGITTSWTTAIANTDNQRHLIAQNLHAQFHLLQIRVTFTDNTISGFDSTSRLPAPPPPQTRKELPTS